jgi:hypothetical protein
MGLGKVSQKATNFVIQNSSPTAKDVEAPFGSNCVRLSLAEWIFIAVVGSASFCLVPALWERLERFDPGPDYRLPYELGNDYWLYDRYCQWACSRYDTLVIGDSVIWGHYVAKTGTLSHHLNELARQRSGIAGQQQFANLGVDGIHPIALDGLVKYYGRSLYGKKVILHLNPLWLSSRKHDLQIEKEFSFNHPQLVPQFLPRIPCYKATYATRISAVLQRHATFFSWTSHLRKAYFQNMDLPTWSLEHPYANPLKAITLELPHAEFQISNSNATLRSSSLRSTRFQIPSTAKTNFEWVELGTSLQWQFFRRTIHALKARENEVFVLVGPFNEHMMTDESLEAYFDIKKQIEAWLRQNNIAYYMPAVLASELYCDASHPLSEGYALLAEQLFDNSHFRSSILRNGYMRK